MSAPATLRQSSVPLDYSSESPGMGQVTAGSQRRPGAQAPHAVVIGSGFGGLAAALRLRVKGYQVTVLERLEGLGGRAFVHRQDGFTFDAGPTIITAPFLLEELWALCGRRFADDVDLRPMMPFYRIRFHDGSHFDYFGETQAMRAEVARVHSSKRDTHCSPRVITWEHNYRIQIA